MRSDLCGMLTALPMLLAAACSSSDAKSAATPAASTPAATAEGSSVDLAVSAPPPARTDASADPSNPQLAAPVSSALDAHSTMADALLSSSASATPHDPVASVSIGDASVTGESLSNVAQVIAGQAAGFRHCYQIGLKDAPNAKGSFRVFVQLGPNGEVRSATSAHAGTLPESIVSCIVTRIRSMQFAKPDDVPAAIVIPITLATAD